MAESQLQRPSTSTEMSIVGVFQKFELVGAFVRINIVRAILGLSATAVIVGASGQVNLAVAAPPKSPTKTTEIEGSTITIADSTAIDPAAKRIRRTVASEALKTISTKERESDAGSVLVVREGSNEALAVDHLEEPQVVIQPKVLVEAAPGANSASKLQEKATETRTPAAALAAPLAAKTVQPLPPVAAEAPRQEVVEVPVVQHSKPSQPVQVETHGSARAESSHSLDQVPAEKSLKWLTNGNLRFVKKNLRTDGRSQADRARLSKSQKPHAIVLSCSDSRVPPEMVFDQALGEIFVIRTAGESIDASVLASIEYAVEHLGPKLLVVMGHTSCGAVKAAIETPADKTAGSASLDQILAEIRPRLPDYERTPASSHSHGLETESAANAKGVAADLLKRSEIIRNRVQKGDLLIKPALYYLDSGSVKFY